MVPHTKRLVNFLNLRDTHVGIGSTRVRYQNLLAPSAFKIRVLPTKERFREDHRLRVFSSLDRMGSKILCSRGCPETVGCP